MVCGSFGHQSLTPHASKISIFNAIMAILAVCFGIVGCVSYTNKSSSLENAPWMQAEFQMEPAKDVTVDVDYYMGIRSLMIQAEIDGLQTATITTYKDCMNDKEEDADQREACDKCDSAAVGTVTMCSFALIAAGVAFLCFIMRHSCDSAFAKDLGIVAGTASFVFGVISYTVFLKCRNAIEDSDMEPLNKEIKWGIGAKLVLGSFVLMLLITFINLITPVQEEEEEVNQDDSKA